MKVETRLLPDAEVRLRNLLRRVEKTLRGVLPDGEYQEVTLPAWEALAWYARVRSLFSSVRLLLEEGYPEEASILGRSIFETSLKFELLADVDDLGRERLILNELRTGLDQEVAIFHHNNIALGLGTGLTDQELGSIDELRRQIARRQARLGLGRLAKFPDDKTLATKFGRLEEYQAYRLTHEITHGSHIAQATRSRYPARNERAVYHRNHNVSVLVGVGAFSALGALRATVALSTFVPRVSRGGLEDLIAEAKSLDDELNPPATRQSPSGA